MEPRGDEYFRFGFGFGPYNHEAHIKVDNLFFYQ